LVSKIAGVIQSVSAQYLAQVLSASASDLLMHAKKRGGTVASIDTRRLLAFEVPVPSLESQLHAVETLDKFDALTTSLTSGLPAEIAARRKQYEYYRDKLLTFEPAA
jgi:type I restriction enzyme S subunit